MEAVHGPVAPIRSEAEAADWLESLINVERRPDWPYRRFDLAPVLRLLARVGDPQRGLRAIHIAGSKGKGSTALLAESVLRAAGRSVGTFTSPHLERWTERFRLDGRDVDGARLAAAFERLRPQVESLRRDDAERAPTFFDVTTAAALLLFQEARVDVALLEVGLGGRLDSTNVIEPAVTCITSIELEHTDRLGHNHAAIAGEKAGILKRGVPAVAGALSAEARDVVQARAQALDAPVTWLGGALRAELRARRPEGLELHLQDGDFSVDATLGVLGAHQADNAALALACVRRCGAVSDDDLSDAVRRGLAAARLPARGELLRTRPAVLVDAAHTPASARALARMLADLPRQRTHLVLSISSGKDVASILEVLLPLADRVTVTRAEPSRSLAPDQVAGAIRRAAPGLDFSVVPNPHLALRAAAEALAPEDLLCATGSVYLAGIARRVLRGPDPAARVAVTRRSERPGAGR